MKICKTFTFDASHELPFHTGKCKNLHGHTYKLEVTIEGPVFYSKKENAVSSLEGMVMDFGDLKDMVEGVILEQLDHSHLNKIFKNPTAEQIALWIFWNIASYFEEAPNPKLKKVRLWETPTSYVEVNNEDLQHLLKHQRGGELPWSR